jgi:predicted ester cyclase
MPDTPEDVVLALFADLYTGNEPEAADRLLAANFVNHEAAAERSPGPQGAKETAAWLHATFSDLRFDIEDVISDGASVVVRLTMSGRHTGAAGPFADMPVTGRPFRSRQIHIWRVSDGKITDHWAVRDDLGWMTQLGLLSALNERWAAKPSSEVTDPG